MALAPSGTPAVVHRRRRHHNVDSLGRRINTLVVIITLILGIVLLFRGANARYQPVAHDALVAGRSNAVSNRKN